MLAPIADLRLCELMSLRPYVLAPIGLRPYVLSPFVCALMLGFARLRTFLLIRALGLRVFEVNVLRDLR